MSKRVDIKGVIQERLQDAPFVGALIIGTTCNQNCVNCFNQHLKNKETLNVNPKFIIDMIQLNPFNEGVIFGGLEWSDQEDDLNIILDEIIKRKSNLKIMLYTGKKMKDRPNIVNRLCEINKVYGNEVYIKCGPYDKDLIPKNQNGIILASCNQIIYKCVNGEFSMY